MSSVISLYWHKVNSFDVYPRVYYFRGRFIDFFRRFKTVLENLPEEVYDDDLLSKAQNLNEALQINQFSIVVIGKRDLPSEALFITTQSMKKETYRSASKCPSIVVCYTELFSTKEDHFGDIKKSLELFKSSSFYDSFLLEFLIVACKVNQKTSDQEIEICRDKIYSSINTLPGIVVLRENVIVSSEELKIKMRVSYMYEKRIIDAFINIRIFLGFFVKKRTQTSGNLCNKEAYNDTLMNTVSRVIRDPYSLLDTPSEQNDKNRFLFLLTHCLARNIRCNLITFFATKHAMPTWFCTRLCNIVDLENKLIESVSPKTRFLLGSLEFSCCKILTIDDQFRSQPRDLSSRKWFVFIVASLEKDFESASLIAEGKISNMKKIQTVMDKMVYEIDGYLKQTSVDHFDFFEKQLELKIPESLRRSVLGIDGVYGIGTIYNTIEVHLQHGAPDTSSKTLRLLLKKYNLQSTVRIREIQK